MPSYCTKADGKDRKNEILRTVASVFLPKWRHSNTCNELNAQRLSGRRPHVQRRGGGHGAKCGVTFSVLQVLRCGVGGGSCLWILRGRISGAGCSRLPNGLSGALHAALQATAAGMARPG